MHSLYRRYLKAAPRSPERRELLRQLDAEIDQRQFVDDLFTAFSSSVVALVGEENASVKSLFAMPYTPIRHDACMTAVDATFRSLVGYNEYSTQYAQVIINACRVTQDVKMLNQFMAQAVATPTAQSQ